MQASQKASAESNNAVKLDLEGHAADGNDQYLTFIMAEEEYGVDILCVQEIRGWESATPLPNAPAHIKGVINLRGTIVPIIDLRQCFGLEAIEYSAVTVVIVLKVKTSEGARIMGIVVDAVSDVYSLSQSDMRAPPDLGSSVNTDFIKGLVNVNDRMVVILDIDRLLTLEDIEIPKEFKNSIDSQFKC